MFGSRAGRAAKFIPMPTMSWVNTSADGCRIKADVRLNAMTNPFRDIGDGVAHMRWPVWISVLKLQPRKHVLEFIRGGSKGDAIIEIDAAITQSRFKGEVFSLLSHGLGVEAKEKNQPPLVLSLKQCADFMERSGKAHCKSGSSHG